MSKQMKGAHYISANKGKWKYQVKNLPLELQFPGADLGEVQ